MSPDPKSKTMLDRIRLHYSNTTAKTKSEEQIRKESHLVPGVPFSRWFIVPAGIIIQFCVGSVYAWSVFNQPIDILVYGKVTNASPTAFTIAIGFLGLSAALMGPWLERNGPRKTALLGSLAFFAANMLVAISLWKFPNIWVIYLAYGVIGGFGIGLCYISPVSVLQKWFPDRRGFASGVAVCGFGAGSVVMAKVQSVLVNSVGVPNTFFILGTAYLIIMVLAAVVLRTPPPNFSVNKASDENYDMALGAAKNGQSGRNAEKGMILYHPNMSLIEAIFNTDFKLMYIMFFANISFGLLLISRLSNIVVDIFLRTPEEASTIVAIISGFNVLGRLFFSMLSDQLGRKNTYVLLLSFTALIVALFVVFNVLKLYWGFLIIMCILTSCYGGGFSVIPAFLSDKFGSSNVGACHGIILTAWSLAGVVGGIIFTLIFNYIQDGRDPSDPTAFNVNAGWLLCVALAGLFSSIAVKPTPKDSEFLKVFKIFKGNQSSRV